MGTQNSSVKPGYTVDSKITTSFSLSIEPILEQASAINFKSGSFFLFIGVGTLTIKTLHVFQIRIVAS